MKIWIVLLVFASAALNAADIIHYEKKSDTVVAFAARDMARILRTITGRNYRATGYEKPVQSGDIVLGINEALRSQEWHMENRQGILQIHGGDTFGLVYGIYDFLERYAGCSWLAPDTELLPTQPDWKIPEINEMRRPAFLRREMYVGDDLMDPYWRLRNKENYRAAFGLSINYGSPGNVHNLARFVKAVKDPKLFGPSKSGGKSHTLCMTNPEVRKVVLQELIQCIEQDRKTYQNKSAYSRPFLYELGQADGPPGQECWCASCRALTLKEESYSAANLDFVNFMAREIRKRYPEILLETFAYSYTLYPPKTLKALDNVMIRYCGAKLYDPLLPETENGRILEKWGKFVRHKSIWSYWRIYEGNLYPFVKSRRDIAGEIRFCHQEGVENYYAENEEPLSRSFAMLQHWLMLKMLDDPSQDIEKLNDHFMEGYYGGAAPILKKYLERRQNSKRTHLDREFFETVNAWLDQAEKLVEKDPRSLLHVRWERIVVDRTMFQNLDMLLKAGYRPDLKKTAIRFQNNQEALLKSWTVLKSHKMLEKRLITAEQESGLYKHFPVRYPEQFAGCEVCDIHWTMLGSIGGSLVQDPDAVCGVASMNPKYKHRNTYQISFYNAISRRGDGILFHAEDFPQDEKFHLYRLGKTLIMQPLQIIHDSSWLYRSRLPTISIIPEEREIWVSVKFAGPNYVSGSKSKNAVLFDRILLVRNPNPLRAYLPVNSRSNLLKNGTFDAFSKQSILHWGQITQNRQIDQKIMHSGRSSVRLTGSEKSSVLLSYDLGRLSDLKQDLLIRGWCRYQGIRIRPGSISAPFIGLWTLTKNRMINAGYNRSVMEFFLGDYDWVYFESLIDIKQFIMACQRAKQPPYYVQFRVMLPQGQTGSVWVDDLEIIPLEKR